jgi:hypothetical protein
MQEKITVTSELTPPGDGFPPWLRDAFTTSTPPNMLVLHPNELLRQQTIERLHQEGAAVAPQNHLTFNRLLRLLHTDLHLPVLLDDDASNFFAMHQRCEAAAENGHFPFLHVPGVGAWTATKTQRLQRLHGEVMQLRRPFAWTNEPGVAAYHDMALRHEAEVGGTLPALVPNHVLDALRTAEDPPFHLSSIDGLLVLNTAPDFSEIQQDLLLAIASFVPVHQLVHPGSFRLGYHGAYILDEPPCTAETLPSWVPAHDLWTPEGDGWRTPVGERFNTAFTRITVDDRSHIEQATLTLIQAYREQHDGSILVIDGAARNRASAWSAALANIGLQWGGAGGTLSEQPIHHAVLHAAQLGLGMTAWSLPSLLGVCSSSTLPLRPDVFPELRHPCHPDWRPQPDPSVLEDVARNFHVLGGPGAIARWLGVLAQAQPNFAERSPEQKQRALEETQWYLGCLLHAWAPLLPAEDLHLLKRELVGCSTGEPLPLPSSPETGMGWLTWYLSCIDVAQLHQRRAPHDAGLGTLQTLLDALITVQENLESSGQALPDQGRAFVDVLDHVGQSTTVSTSSSRTANINIVTPEDALGCQADLILLAGVDVDSWSMRTPIVPWLDAQAQVELGVFQSDLLVRRGRHHLRHLLNAAPNVIVFDSSPEEGGGPSAPMAEWLSDVRRSNAWHAMRDPPSFLPEAMTQGNEAERRFAWVVRESGHGSWLTPMVHGTVETSEGLRSLRHGHSGADRRQQLGLDVHACLPYDDAINHPAAVFEGYEAGIQGDRRRRQPNTRHLSDGEALGWENRQHLLSIDTLALRPTKANIHLASVLEHPWPHLGHRHTGKISMTVDPRPLPSYGETALSISHRFGDMGVPYVRATWSPSRLEAWLKCPRQAWLKQALLADDDDGVESEDVDVRTRGQVVHETEAAILQGHGVPVGGEMLSGIQPLHAGPMGDGDAGWQTILQFLQRNVAWLGRQNAVSVHRTRDLVDATPEEWQALQEGTLDLPQRGRLARLLEADLALHHASPVAVEWPTVTGTERSVEIETPSSEEASTSFRLFGYADRVDVLQLTSTQEQVLKEKGILSDVNHETPYPLTGEQRPAQRLVVIRDLKSVQGPAPKYVGLRHFRCLFEDLQLALYARAWEVLHPNDRVVGVGASEIGEFTTHYVELDTDLEVLNDSLDIGEITDVFPLHFPAEHPDETATSPFRRWMVERLTVAQRAINTAASGQVNPTPGSHCDYCAIATSCGASTLNGGGV